MKSLAAKAWVSLAVLVLVIASLLFVPAGTVRYWQGWVYLTVFTLCSVLVTLDLVKHDPALLERRLKGGPWAEGRTQQRIIMVFTMIGFIGLLVVPPLDIRYRGSGVSSVIVVLGDALVALGYWFIALVYRENSFTAATIQIAPGQRVVSTGPYAIVRHPMYASATLYLVGTPLALGSFRGLAVVVAMLPFLLWRLMDEERFLARNLAGYTQYQSRVRYRLVPFVW
jgi:protein-S-isoprenylcysteine O-methyltransferase Ste14